MNYHRQINHVVSSGNRNCVRSRRHAPPHIPGTGGFSLIEMIVVIIVVGIIFSLGSVLLGRVFSSYALKRDVTDADWQAKVALERAARELRAIRSASATDLDIATGAQVRFFDTDGNGVCFYRDVAANRLMRSADGPTTACGTTSPQVLADNITLLNFTYWDDAGALTATVASVYYVTASLTVVEGSSNASYRTNVHPRNF